MPITEKQRSKRIRYIGSSDSAAILGLNPWSTPSDVYLEKVEDLAPQEDSEAAKIGKVLENSILGWCAKEKGFKIIRNQFRVHENGIMAVNFDALVEGGQESVEAKTAGVLNFFDRDEWGEIGTDEIPNHYIIQIQHGMAVVPELKLTWVPVLLGGVGLRMYRVERNDELIDYLQTYLPKFWKEHVEPRIRPVDPPPTMEVLRRIRRQPSKVVKIDSEELLKWRQAKELLKAAEEQEDTAKRALIASLGDAEGGECEAGVVTYMEQKRAGFVAKDSVFRVFRFKKGA